MHDGTNDAIPSAVRQVASLAVGASYCRARFVPSFCVTPTRIKDAKRELMQSMSPVIARARLLSPANDYRAHTIHSFTRDYDVVVAVIVVREEELPL